MVRTLRLFAVGFAWMLLVMVVCFWLPAVLLG